MHMHKQTHSWRTAISLFLTGTGVFWDQIVLWSAPISVVCIFHRGTTVHCIEHVLWVWAWKRINKHIDTDILTHRHIPPNPQLWAHKHRPNHKQGQSWLKPRCFQEIVLLICYHGWVLLLMKIDGESVKFCVMSTGLIYVYLIYQTQNRSEECWRRLVWKTSVRIWGIQQDYTLVGLRDRCLVWLPPMGTRCPCILTAERL